MEKKVYADYHGLRYTREIDGTLGQWKLNGTAQASKVPQRYVNWNADKIDDHGRHQTSAQAYPVVGMQSQNDPEYAEYQILLAKASGIDGFMVEWGFPGHQSDRELKLLLEVATKHGFEIGITWCDAWHFYDWIEKLNPEIVTRQDKLKQFKKSIQYLLENVYATNAGIVIDGHPIIFLFGGGPTEEEFREIKAAGYLLPEGLKEPVFIGRAPITGQYDETTKSVIYDFDNNAWYSCSDKEKALLDGCFGWIPTRVRRGEESVYPNWDRYATGEDAIAYLQALQEANRERADQFKLNISVVNPEMDNRGCASWGKHDLSYIPRENGAIYESMWQYNCKHRADIDIVFAVTWNDFTEMTQIEPTVEDGDRELVTTSRYAAIFKGVTIDTSGLSLPLMLFQLRKELGRLSTAGYEGNPETTMLNAAATLIGSGMYEEAGQWLEQTRQRLLAIRDCIVCEKVTLTVPSEEVSIMGENEQTVVAYDQPYDMSEGLSFVFHEDVAGRLRNHYFEGFVSFEYWDETHESFTLLSDTDRSNTAFGDYSIVCDIKKDDTRRWVKVRTKLFKANCALSHGLRGMSDFSFTGHVLVRGIKFDFKIYRFEEEKNR